MPEDRAISRQQLISALTRCGGNRTVAARELGISRATLYRLLVREQLATDAVRRIGGRYEVVGTLGEGEQSTVLAVRDHGAGGAERALKLLRESGSNDKRWLEQEFRTLSLLRHPGLVRVFDYGFDEGTGRQFLVMELLSGLSFLDACRERPLLFALNLALDTLDAVAHLHRHGIVHRDLKSENVLIGEPRGEEPRVTVMDLGLQEQLAGERSTLGGTILYLAPELCEGARASSRSDLYALGVLFYAACAGRFPYQGESAEETRARHLAGEALPPSAWCAEVSPELSQWVMRLMAREPQHRFADATAALEALRELLPGASAPRRPLLDGEHQLVGRGALLADLLAEITGPKSDSTPCLLLTGEAGIGKSRVLEALLGELTASGWRTTRAAFRQGEGQELAPLAALIAQSGGAEDELPAAPSRAAALERCVERLSSEAEHRPLVVALEDLHWADPFLLDLLGFLARRARRLPLRVIATSRPPADWPAVATLIASGRAEGILATCEVGPLDLEGVRELASAALGPARGTSVGEELLRLSGGSPFFVAMILRDILERGVDDAALSLPPAAEDSLLAMLARTGQAGIELLAVLATQERAAQVDELATLCGEGWERTARELSERRLITVDGGKVDFVHAHVRDAVRRALSAERSRELHRGWAELAQGEHRIVERAAHLLAAGEGASAAPLFIRAAERLERAWQHSASIPFWEAALEALGTEDPERLKLYPRLERACKLVRDTVRSVRVCEDWAQLARRVADRPAEAQALRLLATRLRDRGEYGEALRVAENALSISKQGGDTRGEVHATKIIGSVLWVSWDHSASLPYLCRAIEMYRALGDRHGLAVALNDAAVPLAISGRRQGSLNAVAEARALFEEVGDRAWALASETNRALVLTYLGDLESVAQLLPETFAALKRLGAALPFEIALENLLIVQLRLGRYADALRTGESLLEEALRYGRQAYRISALLHRGEALFQLDDREAARDHHRLALALAEAFGESAQLQFARLARARDTRVEGRLEAARADALAVYEAAREKNSRRLVTLAATELARLALHENDLAESHRWLDIGEEQLLVAGEDGPALRAALLYERARARWLGGEVRLALGELVDAIGLARRSGPLELLIRLLGFEADLRDAQREEVRAVLALDEAGGLIEQVAEGLAGEPQRRAQWLARPEFAALINAARRRRPAVITGPAGEAAMHRFFEVGRAASLGGDLQPLLEKVVEASVHAAGSERGLLLLINRDSGRLEPRAAIGVERETREDALRISRTVLSRADKGEAVLVRDAPLDPELSQAASVAMFGIRSVMCVPLRAGDEVLGTLYVDSRSSAAFFSEEDLRFLQALADQAAVAIAWSRMVEEGVSQTTELRTQIEAARRGGSIVGESAAIRSLLDLIGRAGRSDVPVLIEGESGVGKELVAQALHAASPRAGRPFIAESCAALPETLLESALFGHRSGAFTGADRDKLGLLQLADGGTLFLDEVAEMSPGLQAKLLRALQEGEIRPLGGTDPIKVNVRLISATHRHLPKLIAEGRFRQDLFFRINGLTILVPPLRDRRDDIPLLINHFLEREAAKQAKAPPRIDAAVRRALGAARWPGNVRELENAVRRLMLLSEGDRITLRTMRSDPDLAKLSDLVIPTAPPIQPGPTNDELEALRGALKQAHGNRDRAAKLLGMSRATFYRRLKQMGLSEGRGPTPQH